MSWSVVEGEFSDDLKMCWLVEIYCDWGILIVEVIILVCWICLDILVIGFGGVCSGLDVVKVIRLGVDFVG